MAAGIAVIVVMAVFLHYFLVDAEKEHLLEREELAARMLAYSLRLPFTQVLLYEELGVMAEGGLLDFYISRMVTTREMNVVYAMVLDRDGAILSHSDVTPPAVRLDDPLTRAALAADSPLLNRVGDPFRRGVIDVAVPLNISSKRLGALRFGYSLASLADKLAELKRTVFALTLAASVLMIILVVIAARVMTRPVLRLVSALDSVRLGRLEAMQLPERNDELGHLQTSYRIMIDRLRTEQEDREKTRELLAGTEKMVTLGTLSAGIAHEINNPLTGAMHGVQALKRESLPPRKKEQYLRVIEESLIRMKRTVSQFLEYSTAHATNFSECNLTHLVGQALSLLSFQIAGNRIEVVNDLPPLTVWGDACNLEQVLVNMVLNAVDAMPGGGRLTFRHVADDRILTLVITDTGIGIPEENLSRIFEPFFTTKGIGQGTGLGLAVCRKIIEQHGGTISVESRPGEGATFRLAFPVTSVPGDGHGK